MLAAFRGGSVDVRTRSGFELMVGPDPPLPCPLESLPSFAESVTHMVVMCLWDFFVNYLFPLRLSLNPFSHKPFQDELCGYHATFSFSPPFPSDGNPFQMRRSNVAVPW